MVWKHLIRWGYRSKDTPARKDSENFNVAQKPLQLSAAVSSTNTYDPLLLDRLWSYWKIGDWEALCQIESDDIATHPAKAEIALLVAAGNEQVGKLDAARHFLERAKNWGASERQIAQLMISSVHNTLGRARLISGAQQDAAKHFSLSLAANNVRGADQLSSNARMQRQYHLLKLDDQKKRPRGELGKLAKSEENPPLGIEQLNFLKQEVIEAVKGEVGKGAKQLEAYIGIQSYLIHGQLTPAMHGWPISPDFGYYLLQILETQRYDLVIEFGSGTSTVLVARALANVRRNTGNNESGTPHVAFEHLPKYFDQTSALLKKHDSTAESELVLAELDEREDEYDGNIYNYYKCDERLSEIAKAGTARKILVIVDGPPASTGKHARYPALPSITRHFPGSELDIILDDFDRQDEQETVQKWVRILKKQSRSFQHRKLDFEKGGSHLHVDYAPK